MSDPDSFLTRWSRRKREVAEESEERRSPEARSSEPSADAGSQPPAAGESALPLVDLTKLPAIGSITAETDIRPFLAPGVPTDLKLAALRRAWVADPKIRDFIEVADYDFDFHTPGAIPGFGPLEMTDELRREIARMFSGMPPEDQPSPSPAGSEPRNDSAPPMQPTAATEEINAHPGPTMDATGPTSRSLSEDAGRLGTVEQSKLAQMQSAKDSAAVQQSNPGGENLQTPARRSHGGALPK